MQNSKCYKRSSPSVSLKPFSPNIRRSKSHQTPPLFTGKTAASSCHPAAFRLGIGQEDPAGVQEPAADVAVDPACVGAHVQALHWELSQPGHQGAEHAVLGALGVNIHQVLRGGDTKQSTR